MSTKTISNFMRIGWFVITALMVLTAIEFIVAVILQGIILAVCLFVIGLIKGALIVQYFMHFGQIWEHIRDLWRGIIFTVEEEG
jgi:cytochrome c oxidase subunit IV